MPTSALSLASSASLTLDIRTTSDEMVGYDRLEVWRSKLGEGGPFEELSGPAWCGATLPVGAGSPSSFNGPLVNAVGKKLDIRVNQSCVITVTFTGTNPITYKECATQITAAAPNWLKAYVDDKAKLVISTVPVGGKATLEILGGDAAPLLSLPLSSEFLATGFDPRPFVRPNVFSYVFQDYFWDKSYTYKTRFSNSLSGVHSEFSPPFLASDRSAVSPENIVIGYVKLYKPDGRASESEEVTVYNRYNAQILGDGSVVGGPKLTLTDDNGYAEFPLLRGITVDVAIGGTNMMRTVEVPKDPSVLRFNLFDPKYGKDDNFAVQQASLPYAQRGTL